MDIYKGLVISLMFSICLTSTHLYKTKWLTTPIGVHRLMAVLILNVFM